MRYHYDTRMYTILLIISKKKDDKIKHGKLIGEVFSLPIKTS